MRTQTCFYLIGLLLIFGGCDSETIAPQENRVGFSYFPLSVGNYAVYAVENIQYNFGQEPDTSLYQLKEVVADSFPGNGGETVYRLERFTRMEEEAWQLDSVWTARKSSQRIVVVENNVPLVKLVFPFQSGLVWDGNALNSRPEQMYSLIATSETLAEEMASPMDSLLAHSLTVMQEESLDTVILYTQKLETYVEDVGLFYKKSVNLHYCASTPECLGLGILESGRRYKQILIDYGKE